MNLARGYHRHSDPVASTELCFRAPLENYGVKEEASSTEYAMLDVDLIFAAKAPM